MDIEQALAKIEALEKRVAELERRPVYVPVYQQAWPQYQPQHWYQQQFYPYQPIIAHGNVA